MTKTALKTAIKNNTPLVWNDPEPIPGNDYTITAIHTELDEIYVDTPILITYGAGSEAEVFLSEISVK